MRRTDDYIRAGADASIRKDFEDGIDAPLVGDSRRRTASQEADRRRREREMSGFMALQAATSG
jgi:hypothetical protein